MTSAITSIVVTHDQHPYLLVLLLDRWQRAHEHVKTAQAFEIAINKGDGGDAAINRYAAYLKIHLWVGVRQTSVNPLVNHMESLIAEFNRQAVGLMAGEQYPSIGGGAVRVRALRPSCSKRLSRPAGGLSESIPRNRHARDTPGSGQRIWGT